ncbi:death-on-curing family protein [Paucilactobacillus hokkaidonensis JCM 18461]|uniref:Death-on-curing family protein n=2 Tax=Paucilactobacillus hokkaidonensis TaxID=1193095 RepID=A0A0A1GWD4_9LACO|nr:type II toxin-antitoxin system death-on-curing family toxin [Paucilactobacillus hokkaidonensis]KRO10009.1 hypothetical protein IV59_GL002210 [Paucilactobacillus hokkaidonensis]BAP86325.1 death-on-curing family protein [Paucilactobacillus hokkaidonensis JCM 18461]
MNNIIYLTADIVIAINHQIVEINGVPKQKASIKDSKALESLIALPKQTSFGQELYPSMSAKAAIIFIKIIKKHVFADANKRTAVISLLWFLRKNNYNLNVNQKQLADYTLLIAKTDDNQLNYNNIIRWIDERISKTV